MYSVRECLNIDVMAKCSNLDCKQKIRGVNHSMIKREGHVRVFKDQAI